MLSPGDKSLELAEKRAHLEKLRQQLAEAQKASQEAHEKARTLRSEIDTLKQVKNTSGA